MYQSIYDVPLLLDEGRAAKNGSKEAIYPYDVIIWTTGLRLRGSVPPLVPPPNFPYAF